MQLKRYTESKKEIILLIICIVSFVLGVILGIFGKEHIDRINPNNAKAAGIFGNNILVGISIMFLGGITGGVYGISVLCINGYIVGKLVGYLLNTNMEKYIFTGILPHLCLELLGLSIFAVIGFFPICEMINWIRKGRFSLPVKKILKKTCVMGGIGSINLFFAAIIESCISTAG